MAKIPKSTGSSACPIGLHPGAVWKRADFQVHTPRDSNWNGDRFGGADEAGRKARIEWSKGLLREAHKRGLNAIAITDHHDLAYVESVRAAAKELAGEVGGNIWVFPGMEITCNDSCQCLVLLNPEIPLGDAERLYGSGFLNVHKHPYEEEKLPSTKVLGLDLSEFVKKISQDVALKDCSLILPHAGKDHSHKTIFREGFQERFANLPCDGFYIEHPFEKLDDKHLRRLRGDILEWGSRRRGVLATGDNRSAKFESLGKNPCWVRMGEPTVESVRQAVLADEARITFSEPSLPSQRILGVEISSSLCGDKFKVSFNDGFTAIIGGRGSGKSAVLEYLRFGLGRAIFDVDEEPEGEAARLKDLIQDTLAGGHVVVHLIRDGIEESWTRRFDDHGTIEVQKKEGSKEKITPDVAHDRFRARGYHQKQLSSLRSSGIQQVDQITGIAAAELVSEQADNAQQIATATIALSIALKTLNQRWDTEGQIDRAQKRIEDIKARCLMLQNELKSKGVSTAAQDTLKLAPEYAKAKQYFGDVLNELDERITDVSNLKDSINESFLAPTLSKNADFKSIEDTAKLVDKCKDEMSGQLEKALQAAKNLKTEIGKQHKIFEAAEKVFNEKYKKAQAEQKQNKDLLEALAKLNRELEDAEKAHKALVAQGNKLKGAEADFVKARGAAEGLRGARAKLYQKAATHANEQSQGRLRASVLQYRPSEDQRTALLGLLHGSRVQNVEELVGKYLEKSNEDSWHAICDELLDLWKKKVQTGPSITPQDADATTVSAIKKIFAFATLSDAMAARMWQQLTLGRIEVALTAVPGANIQFDYKDQSGKFIPFAKASPGQQAAALLTLLLNQQAGTLIIDQPEEDLDNRVIMDVVKLLRTTKRNRQLIFATHNANFVVNGDADKVVVVGSLASGAQSADHSNPVEIAVDGAIETPVVRDTITLIMEGGKEAFALRGRKYAFPPS